MTLRKLAIASLIPAAVTMIGASAMAQQAIEYKTETTTYEGTLFAPETNGELDGVGVLIAHDFLGPSENQFSMARDYAAKGATVFVADFYGKDVRPEGPDAATTEAVRVRGAVPELRAAMSSALSELTAQGVDANRTAVIGTSVGGLAALELARTGADLGAVAVVWGVLENTEAETAQKITAPVTLFQGDLDPLAPAEARDAIAAEFEAMGVAYDLQVFEGVAHAFTLSFMGTDTSSGFAYDEAATQQSLARVEEILRGL